MKGLFDTSELKRVDLYSEILDIENDLLELNDSNWSWSMGSEQDILRVLNDLLDDFDFYKVDYLHDYEFMWCGILHEWPFSELDMSEETILNTILQDFIYVEYDKGIYLSCKPTNSKSKLYKFFYKHKEDAGGNFEYAINDMLHTISKYIIKKIKDDPDRYGDWEEAIYPTCPECGGEPHYCESETEFECPDCGYTCKMSQIETISHAGY